MHIDAYNNKGNFLYSLRRYEEAIACYDKALEIDANYAYPWYNKGNSLAKLERYEEAIACYDNALTVSPNDPYILQNRAHSRWLKILCGRGTALDISKMSDDIEKSSKYLTESKAKYVSES